MPVYLTTGALPWVKRAEDGWHEYVDTHTGESGFSGYDDDGGSWRPPLPYPPATAPDLEWGSEAGCFVIWLAWFATNRRKRDRSLMVSTVVTGLTFELIATALGILEHNPGYVHVWLTNRVPLSVIASWSVGLAMHMALSDRTSLPWWAKACLDVLSLTGMDIMTEVGGVSHYTWRWPLTKDGLGRTDNPLFEGVPHLMDTLVWGVPLMNYVLVPATVLAHSMLFRGLADSESCTRGAIVNDVMLLGGVDDVVAHGAGAIVARPPQYTQHAGGRSGKGRRGGTCSEVPSPLTVFLTCILCPLLVSLALEFCVIGYMVFGDVLVTALVTGVPCALALRALWQALRGIGGYMGPLVVAPTPLMLPVALGASFLLNTTRMLAAPEWTTAQAVTQAVVVTTTLALTLWPTASAADTARQARERPSGGSNGSSTGGGRSVGEGDSVSGGSVSAARRRTSRAAT